MSGGYFEGADMRLGRQPEISENEPTQLNGQGKEYCPIERELEALLNAGPLQIEQGVARLSREHGIGKTVLRTTLKQIASATIKEYDAAHEIATSVRMGTFAGGDHLMFLHDGAFWKYDGRVWARQPEKMIRAVVAERAARMFEDKKFRAKTGIRSLDRIIIEATRLLESFVTRPDDPLCFLQPPPNVMNLTNGELHLDTGEFRPHDPRSYLRTALDVAYDPGAGAPVFERVTLDIMGGDREMQRHLHEVLAYVLSPEKWFAAFVLFIGDGSNGKTLLSEVLQALMGSALLAIGFDELTRNQFTSNALVGKSAVLDDDVDTAQPLAIATIKKISEKKLMAAEVKYGAQYQFICAVTPIGFANDFPPVRDNSYGFDRRANVIRFEQKYVLPRDAEAVARRLGHSSAAAAEMAGALTIADESLSEQLRAEASGILNVLLAALKRLRQRRGFDEPPRATEARTAWRMATDSVLRFIREECTPDGDTLLAAFKAAYADWCGKNGYRAKSSHHISEAITRGGYVVSKTKGVSFVRKIRLPVDRAREVVERHRGKAKQSSSCG